MANEFPLALIIKAVDQATAPLRKINERIHEATAPVRKLNNSFKALAEESGLTKLGERFGHARHALAEVGSEAVELGKHLLEMEVIGGIAFYELLKSTIECGAELGKMAQRVGLSVDAYAQLQFAAGLADIEQEAFNSAMDQFNKRLGEAKAGGGPLLEFLNKVSPALARQVRGAKNTEEALTLVTRAFEKVTDPGKRAALAAALFGKSGLQMGQFLGQGEKAIGALRQRFEQIAGSQTEFTEQAEEGEKAFKMFGAVLVGLRNSAIGPLLPAFSEFANAISNVLAGKRGQIAAWAKETGEALSRWVKGGGVDRLITSMTEWGKTIGRVVDLLGGLKGIAVILGVYLASGFIGSVFGAAGALWNLGAAIVPMVIKAFVLLLPALGSAVHAILLFNFAPLIAGLVGASGAVWAFTAALLANPITWIILGIVALCASVYLIYKYWGPIKEFFVSLWDSIVEVFTTAWQKVKPIVDAITTAMQFTPMGIAYKVTKYAAGKVFGADEAARPTLGAENAAPGSSGKTSQAHVVVDFNNMPAGARVTSDPGSTASLDTSMGYSMLPSH